jgi:hypothetical protein
LRGAALAVGHAQLGALFGCLVRALFVVCVLWHPVVIHCSSSGRYFPKCYPLPVVLQCLRQLGGGASSEIHRPTDNTRDPVTWSLAAEVQRIRGGCSDSGNSGNSIHDMLCPPGPTQFGGRAFVYLILASDAWPLKRQREGSMPPPWRPLRYNEICDETQLGARAAGVAVGADLCQYF